MNFLRNRPSSRIPFKTKQTTTQPSTTQPSRHPSNKSDNVYYSEGSAKQAPSNQIGTPCRHEVHYRSSLYQALPVELWLDILQHAMAIPFALDAECMPRAIYFFYAALGYNYSSNPGLKAWRKTKANLRLVCRTWKTVVDHVQLPENSENPYDYRKSAKYEGCDGARDSREPRDWITTFDHSQADAYGPSTRFDISVFYLSEFLSMRKKYRHDIRVIRLQIRFAHDLDYDSEPETGIMGQESLFSLTRLITRPWTLKVLHLSLTGHTRCIPIQLLQGLPQLCTLSIAFNNPLKFTEQFNSRSLTTLLITFGDVFTANSNRATLNFADWYFPNLHTLLINMKGGLQSNGPRWGLASTPVTTKYNKLDLSAINTFVRRHKETLLSLSVMPFSAEYLVGSDSRLEVPSLEALTTDFVRFSPLNPSNLLNDNGNGKRNGMKRLWMSNIKHLIHVSTQTCSQKAFAINLLQLLRSLRPAAIQSVTVTEKHHLIRETPYTEDKKGLKELQRLDKYCQDNKIRVYGDMGLEVCCIQTAWKQMVRVR